MIPIRPADILKFCKAHLPTILSGAAAIGVIATGVTAYKAGKHVEEENRLGRPSKWTNYILPVVCGGVTICFIIFADRLNAKQITELLASAVFWKQGYNKLEEKVTDILGEDKVKEIKDEIVNENISKEALKTQASSTLTDGSMLCYEPYTEQFFRATKEQLLWAELTANKMFCGKGGVKLNEVLELFPGCNKKPLGETIGWFLDDTGCFNASYYFPGCAHQYIDIQPVLKSIDGVDCMVIHYGLCPYEPDEPEEWK